MPEACQTAYRSSPPEIQNKIRRVVEVWKTRNVFEGPIVEAIDARLDEVDKSKGASGKKTLMGKSLYGSSSGSGMPKELETLGPLQAAVTKASLDARPSIDTADREYSSVNDPDASLPTPPVHAARLSSLIKSLAAAESSINASIKKRQALVADLERILETNRTALKKDEDSLTELNERRTVTETKKREVEDSIMRGLTSTDNSPEAPDLESGNGIGRPNSSVDERPEVEELTPEPEEAFSPPFGRDELDIAEEVAPLQSPLSDPIAPAPSLGFGEAVSTSRVRVASDGSVNVPSAKRRKMSHEEDNAVPDLGGMGMENLGQERARGDVLVDLDADVNELLRQEGGGSMY